MIKNYFKEAGFDLNSAEEEKIEVFLDLFLSWNEKINISGIKDREEVIIKHLVDSILVMKFFDFKKVHRVLDVGTGGGLPGLPLAIMNPRIRFSLLDATAKKLKVVEDIIHRMKLLNVRVLWGRAEEVAREVEVHESYDLVVARALAELPTLLRWCLPFVKKKHWLIAYKGPRVDQETGREEEETLKKYRSKFVSRGEFDLPKDMGKRVFLLYQKVGPTRRDL